MFCQKNGWSATPTAPGASAVMFACWVPLSVWMTLFSQRPGHWMTALGT